MPICYFPKTSKKVPENISLQESNLSIEEMIEKAKEDCLCENNVWTMNPFYLESLVVFADKYNVLNKWKFFIIDENESFLCKIENKQEMFEMFSKTLDPLFLAEWESFNGK